MVATFILWEHVPMTTKYRKLTKQDKELARRIKELRREKGLTQEQLSARLSANLNYVASIESLKRGVSLPKLYKLARIFRVKVKILLDFD